jgi:serine/threonine-protein kinase
MGTVCKAVQAPLDRLVALKVLRASCDSSGTPGFSRFFLEASVTR